MSNAELQTLLTALLAKLGEPSEPKPQPAPQPRAGKTRMKEVPITAREDPDIDPYEVLPPIDRATHEYVFCRNGRWRAVPKQTPEQIKERTEKMLETKLRKRAEATKRMEEKLTQIKAEKMSEESMVEAPVEKKVRKVQEPPSDSAEADYPDEVDPEVAKMVADHIAERQRKEEAARTRNSASSSVFGVSVTHQ